MNPLGPKDELPLEANLQELEDIIVCIRLVRRYFKGDETKVKAWFATDNPALGNMAPADLLQIWGRPSQLRRIIEQLLEEGRGPGSEETGVKVATREDVKNVYAEGLQAGMRLARGKHPAPEPPQGAAEPEVRKWAESRIAAYNEAMRPLETMFVDMVKASKEIGYGRMQQLIQQLWDEELKSGKPE